MVGRVWWKACCLPSRQTLMLVTGGILLPNLLAIVANIWIGGPSRTVAIAAYAAVALACTRLPRLAAIPLFIVAIGLEVLMAVGHIFFLDLRLMQESLPVLAHVQLLASPFYVGLIVTLSLFIAANLAFLMRYGTVMARGNRAVFAVTVLGYLAADVRLNSSVNLDLGPTAGINQPFQSAVAASGFGDIATPSRHKRNVLLVMVESLGVLIDPTMRSILFSAFDDEGLKGRFAVTEGTTTFFGATAHGEMRELCQTRTSYQAYFDQKVDRPCLPNLFSALGYRTVSVHGFTSAFYDRRVWYPHAGFVRSVFGETASPPYVRRCGGPFVGFCDVDIADRISTKLAETKPPLFVYWLTLNSHVPVRPGQATRRHACETGGPFGDPEVCAMAEIWEDLFAAVSRLAMRNPETEILLVGDHAPPLWRRAARSLFEPDRVPWIRLSPHSVVQSAAR